MDVVKDAEIIVSDVDEQEARNAVVQASKDFKSAWKSLAKSLHVVWQKKYYKEWGFELFDDYVAKEVGVRKNTAMKLIRSYNFLEKEEPTYLESEGKEDEERSLPSLDVVSVLQKAKKSLDPEQYSKIKRELCEEQRDVKEVKKDLTSMISKNREEQDPETARKNQRDMAIRRIVSALGSARRDIQMLRVLPMYIADEITQIMENIEAETERE